MYKQDIKTIAFVAHFFLRLYLCSPTPMNLNSDSREIHGIVSPDLVDEEPLSYIDLDESSTPQCPSLCLCVAEAIAHCSRNGITSLSAYPTEQLGGKYLTGLFPPSTTTIHLGYNNITVLPPRMLQNITRNGVSNITNLYLQGNQIREVHPNAFAFFIKLQQLDLSQNLISSLNQRCFSVDDNVIEAGSLSEEGPLSCANQQEVNFLLSAPRTLRILNLNRNLIRGIPNHSFSALKNIETLTLSGNRITWISGRAFAGLHKLKVLQLRSNPLAERTTAKLGNILEHFMYALIPVLPEEERILQDASKLFRIPDREINSRHTDRTRQEASSRHLHRTKRQLKYSKLRENDDRKRKRRSAEPPTFRRILLNSLESLDLGDANLREFPSVLPESLKRLYLDENMISTIPEMRLRQLAALEVLHLGGNRIQTLPDSVFSNQAFLRTLDLSRNDLTRLTTNTFAGLLQVCSLRLNGNQRLSELPKKVFWSMPSLGLLYLQDCNLSTLPSGPWIHRLYAIWLYGNPIVCDCQTILPISIRFLHPGNRNLRLDPYRAIVWDDGDAWRHQRPEKTVCSSPQHFKNYRLQDIRLSDVRCSIQDWYEASVSRSMANSRFPSKDYQHDESSYDTRTDNEIDEHYDYPSAPVGEISKLSNEEKVFNFSDVDIWSDAERLLENHVKDTKDDIAIEKYLFDDLPEVEDHDIHESTIQEPSSLEMMLNELMNKFEYPQSGDGEFKISNGETQLIHDSSDEIVSIIGKHPGDHGQHFVIKLPKDSSIDGADSIEIFDFGSTVATIVDLNITDIEFEKVEEEPFDVQISIRPVASGHPELGVDVDYGEYGDYSEFYNENLPQELQSSKPIPVYDEGVVIPNEKPAADFESEVERALDSQDLQEYRRRLKEFDAWSAYQDYYNNEELSGDGDLLNFPDHSSYFEEYDLGGNWTDYF